MRPFIREVCRFASHAQPYSPPFSQLDMIVCRETLAKLRPAARRETLQSFHRALAPGGLLLEQGSQAGEAPELFAAVGRAGPFYAARRLSLAGPARSQSIHARLHDGDERFRVLFSQADEAILARDAETNRILDANEAAQRLFGMSAQELVGLQEKDLAVAPEAVRRVKAERRSEERLRLPHFRRKDGSVFAADTSTTFLMLHGRPSQLWVVRDATERLRLKTGRKREEEQQAFVGEVVHELRSPVAIIQGFAETLRRGVKSTSDRREFLKSIEGQTARMAHLVDRLLDLSAAQSKRVTNPVPIFAAKAVWQVVSAFVAVARRRAVSIRIDIDVDLAVAVDPADLPHIFGNLLDNAIKFSPRGGDVFVLGRAEGDRGIISVKDSGSGIPPEDLNRVFERFFRSERTKRTKGTGLGLAIVRGIVTANRGHVYAENDPAGGAVFHVALPLAQGIPGDKANE